MPSNPTATETVRQMIEAELAEVEKDRENLRRALRELPSRGGGGAATRAKPSRRRAGASRSRKGAKGGKTRGEQALELISATPGIKGAELAKQMKVSTSNVYQVLARLKQRKQITTKDGQYFPAGSSASSDEQSQASTPTRKSRRSSKGKAKEAAAAS